VSTFSGVLGRYFTLLTVLLKASAKEMEYYSAKFFRLLPFLLVAALLVWSTGLLSRNGCNGNSCSAAAFKTKQKIGAFSVLLESRRIWQTKRSPGIPSVGLARYSVDGNAANNDNDGVFYNFTDFKKARLRLPEKREPFRPLILDEPLYPRDPFPATLNRCAKPDCFTLKRMWDGINGNITGGSPGKFLNPGPRPAYRLIQNRSCDLNGDGLPEKYILRDGIITVWAGSRLLWQSPQNWWVDYFFLGDVNNDGTTKLNLSVWKEGNFGSCRPFWVEENDKSVKNHLFIFKLDGENLKPVWQSSNLDCPNYWAGLIDPDKSGENKMIVLEGSYTDPQKRKITLWKWNGWGFTRI